MLKYFIAAFIGSAALVAHGQTQAGAPYPVAADGQVNVDRAQLTFQESLRQDNICLIRKAYELPDYDSRKASGAQIVDACITLDQGSGRWYVQTKVDRGEAASPDTPAVQSTLQSSKRLSRAYLEQALAHCEKALADEAQCLRIWKLAP